MKFLTVRYLYPKFVGSIVASALLFSGNVFASTYIVPGPYNAGCGCTKRVIVPPTYRKVKRVYHPCYHKRVHHYAKRRSSYRIEVYYPTIVRKCCHTCDPCTGCPRTYCHERVRYHTCYGRWYRSSACDFDFDGRTADDVYSDF